MTSFAFPFANFFQPGIYWPNLADYHPLQIIAVMALLVGLAGKASYRRMDAVTHPAAKWLFFFLLVQPLSVYRSGLSGMVEEFGFWVTYILFVLLSICIIRDPTRLRRYIWGMMLGSAWVIFVGIYFVIAGLAGFNGGRAGAYGMYENHNDYSFIIIQTLPFFYIYWRTEQGFLRRLVLGAATFGSVVGMFLSLSRGGMMALVLEVLLIVMLTMEKRTRRWVLPLVAALGCAAIGFQYAQRALNQGDSYTAEDSESSRWELWQAGGAMVKAHPILGIGSRRFGEFATDYGEISHDNLGKNAHNTYIEAAATTGLVGLVAFIMTLVLTMKELRRPTNLTTAWEASTRKATLIALYTICFRSMFDVKSWDWSFYILITIAVASGAMLKNRVPVQAPASPPVPEGAAAADVPFSNRLP